MVKHDSTDVVQNMLPDPRHDAHAPIVQSQLNNGNDQISESDIPQGGHIVRANAVVNCQFDKVRSRNRGGGDDDH